MVVKNLKKILMVYKNLKKNRNTTASDLLESFFLS